MVGNLQKMQVKWQKVSTSKHLNRLTTSANPWLLSAMWRTTIPNGKLSKEARSLTSDLLPTGLETLSLDLTLNLLNRWTMLLIWLADLNNTNVSSGRTQDNSHHGKSELLALSLVQLLLEFQQVLTTLLQNLHTHEPTWPSTLQPHELCLKMFTIFTPKIKSMPSLPKT